MLTERKFLKWTRRFFPSSKTRIIMGGSLRNQVSIKPELRDPLPERDNVEKYFRPSCLPVLNNRFTTSSFFHPYYNKKPDEIVLPPSLMDSPENTILNYFSILREAANLPKGKIGGCGTIGMAQIPYPVAYNFLTKDYQKRLPYPAYLKSFTNIAHINLIKLNQVPKDDQHPSTLRFFFELETIEGATKKLTYFAYYYSYIYLQKERDQYKITDQEFFGEDFLCAAYHGWQHNAELAVDIMYGNWCKLIKKRLPTKQEGYVKTIDIEGTDGNQYRFVFFQLTNDTDILVAQYKRTPKGEWELIHIDPEKCLEENRAKSPAD